MAITPNFSASQSISDSSSITLTDTSTGSDFAIASRRIYIQLPNGTYLVQSGTTTNYELWSYSSSTKTLDVISRSVAASITVEWLDSGNTIRYTKTIAYVFTINDDLFIYEKFQDVVADETLLNDVNFYNSLIQFTVNLVGAEKAIELASDTSGAQGCLDRDFNMIANETFFF